MLFWVCTLVWSSGFSLVVLHIGQFSKHLLCFFGYVLSIIQFRGESKICMRSHTELENPLSRAFFSMIPHPLWLVPSELLLLYGFSWMGPLLQPNHERKGKEKIMEISHSVFTHKGLLSECSIQKHNFIPQGLHAHLLLPPTCCCSVVPQSGLDFLWGWKWKKGIENRIIFLVPERKPESFRSLCLLFSSQSAFSLTQDQSD